MTLRRKKRLVVGGPDLTQIPESELLTTLTHNDADLRREVLRELAARGERMGWKVLETLTGEAALTSFLVDPTSPFDAVGVVVPSDRFEPILAAWADDARLERRGETVGIGGAWREFLIDFRNQRLDVIDVVDGEAGMARALAAGMGLREVEIRVTDADAVAARVAAWVAERPTERRLFNRAPMPWPPGSSTPGGRAVFAEAVVGADGRRLVLEFIEWGPAASG
jgi:hypothetical protein